VIDVGDDREVSDMRLLHSGPEPPIIQHEAHEGRQRAHVVVVGGTGYVGRPLIEQLIARGHDVTALARSGSHARVPGGARIVDGSPLSTDDVVRAVVDGCTLVLLVGTPRPSPAKARQFREVDLVAAQAAADAATRFGRVGQLVYVSVAHPAPVMKAYIEVRSEGERLLSATGVPLTVLRPWYVLGPGHWWPYALVPVYAALEFLPATRDAARRLGLVTHQQMLNALVHAVEHPATAGTRIVEVPEIRASVV
jgi:uncharacterized protein YbjT (DUF2867 family)